MSGPLQQLVRKRGYRERGQAAHRSHKYKSLEKKRDWQQRSRRYKRQQELLQHLSEKARTKNPNEFSCKQLRAEQIGGGIEGIKSKNAGLVRLARADASAAFSARSPAAAAAAAAEVLRTSALSSLVSKRSASRLKETKKQLAKAQEKVVSGTAALLKLKEQTLRQQVKKQAAALGRGFGKGGRTKHILLESDTEKDRDSQEEAQQEQHQQEAEALDSSDESESDSECRWLQMAKKPLKQRPEAAATDAAEEEPPRESSESGEEDTEDSAEAYQQMQKALLHVQRLRRLQQQLQQHRDEQKGGKRRQVVVKGKDGKEIKTTKWFQERKK